MQTAVKQAIMSMRERYYDPLTLREIASEVFVSPFHFSRIFSRDTGVTPGRYLTSIRLFEAKRLLLTTSLTVSDIVCSVGYSSVGTFTTRFTEAVGMTPTQYRDPQVGELLIAVAPEFHQFPSLAGLREAGMGCGGVRAASGGAIELSLHVPQDAPPLNIFAGAFGSPLPQCGPIAYTGAANALSTSTTMNNVPAGDWTVIAVAEPAGGEAEPGDVYIATVRKKVTVAEDRITPVSLRLRKVAPTDPPIAITLASGATTRDVRRRAVVERPLPAAA